MAHLWLWLTWGALLVLSIVFVTTTASAHTRTVSYQVQPGDTVWSISRHVAPAIDPRTTTEQILSINHLANTVIYPGEILQVPGN